MRFIAIARIGPRHDDFQQRERHRWWLDDADLQPSVATIPNALLALAAATSGQDRPASS
jgi:hypothetical protein